MSLIPIHPFPARMAPDIALESISDAPNGARVLDPMCGSGTVVRAAAEAGLRCTGVDIDPLAVLMSRVWVTPVNTCVLEKAAGRVVEKAQVLTEEDIEEVSNSETEDFISFWFAPLQREQLKRLATVLRHEPLAERQALSIALSRIIVTKEMVSSLARDTSHSRPHRVADKNDFNVYNGFLKSTKHLCRRIAPHLLEGEALVLQDDARTLRTLEDNSFDLVVTSPPYLNAIDYLRGHKMTLVWLGYDLSEIRNIRSNSVGAERVAESADFSVDVTDYVKIHRESTIEERHIGWIRRYAADMQRALRQLSRVVRPDGRVVLVIGNSLLRGANVNNALLIEDLAKSLGFNKLDARVRSIPARRRYLPPPGTGNHMLDSRMRRETVIQLRVP